MKSFHPQSSVGFLVLALLGVGFSTGTASCHDSKGRLSSWDNLQSLTRGQEIRVVLNNVKSYQGAFESLSDGGITLRQKAGKQSLARKDIFRVSRKVGQNHQVRNMVIGTAVGATAGLVTGLGPYYVKRNCTEGPEFACGYPPNAHWVKVLMPVGAFAGAVAGGVIPTGGWHDLYRAQPSPD